jgi:hypothetical protein
MTDYMAFEPPLADQTEIEGAYLMTATSETVLARAPDGAQHTVFTGSLLRTLRHGVPGGPDLLDMDTVYDQVEADLRGLGEPVPQRRSRNHGHRIALVRNRGIGAPPEVRPPTPEPAVETINAIEGRRWPGGRLIAAVGVVTAVAAAAAFGATLRPDDDGPRASASRTAAASQTSAASLAPPSQTPTSQIATTSPAATALPKSQTLTASTGRTVANQDGRVEIEVFQVSGGLYSYFVITPENSCTVSDTKNGVSTVVPLGGGDWARLVPLRQVYDFNFDSTTPSEIPIVFSIKQGRGPQPKSGRPCT